MGGTREELAGKAAQEERRAQEVRGEGKKVIFLFLGGKVRRYFLYLLGSRNAATAALGYRHRRENVACADRGTRWKTQLVAA